MENQCNFVVANKFSLAIDEDEDPLELIKVREQEKEAKKKEKLSGKENKSKQPEGAKPAGIKPPKPRVIKENQQPQPAKIQDAKKDIVEKKPGQQRSAGGDRNVKFSGESREERNNRRNREDGGGERPQRNHDGPRNHDGQVRRGPPSGEAREYRNSGDGPRGDFADRRGPRAPRMDRGDRPNHGERQDRVDRGDRQDRVDRGDRQDRGRGDRGPRGGGRGGRGGYDNRGKREFDRQSGSDKTGVKPVDKKDGAGSHNWGTHNDEIEESMNPESQDSWGGADKPEGEVKAAASTEVKEGETPAEGSAPTETPAEDAVIDEEAKKLTLDEWKASRAARAKPTYNLRKAGEGEDLTRWKKMYALEKKKEDADEEEEEEEEYDLTVEYPQRVGRQKRVFDIEIQFTDSRRGGGGRGGRPGRGPRGERPAGRGFNRERGPPRDSAPRDTAEPRSGGGPADAPKPAPVQVEQKPARGGGRQNAPKVEDEHDFPSLR